MSQTLRAAPDQHSLLTSPPVRGGMAMMATARGLHTATALSDGRVLVVGGSDAATSLTTSEVYTPATGMWTASGALTRGRRFHTITQLPGGRLLVAGGEAADNVFLASAEVN